MSCVLGAPLGSSERSSENEVHTNLYGCVLRSVRSVGER